MPAVATAGLPQRLGKYEIVMPLAAGGMARIYIARSTGIGMFERHVVLKLITPERANDVTAVQMFLDEARLAASLNHQNVGQVFEVGEDGGIHYLAMEYVHGQDLRALLAKAGSQGTRVPLELALTVVAGAAAGLNHAHERRAPDGTPLGIVHRDVSPSNIMIGYDGAVKLLDFGIAKATSRSVETQSGIIKGKFAYMAPEQCRGRDVDRRSDVFSLGIILYEISTQHRCFRADSDFDTMHRIVTGDVVRPSRIVQGYPQALEAIVMKALAVDPSTRYQSAGALLEAIESFAVSSRMSLSTMSLGRFMRDMFGDSPEPWLTNNGRGSEVVEPKESTISNTNKGNASPPSAPKGLPRPSAMGAVPPSDSDDDADLDDDDANAKTFLMSGDLHADDGSSGANWNGPTDYDPGLESRHSQPTQPPLNKTGAQASIAQPQVGKQSGAQSSIAQAPQRPSPSPSGPVSAQVSTPPTLLGTGRPPAGQFPPTPDAGSQSAARPAVGPVSGSQPIANTRHGYASGNGVTRGDTYPRLENAAEPSAVHQLAPNRRPLFIGLGLAAIGIVVLLVITLGGGGEADVAKEQPIIMKGDDDGSSAVEKKAVEPPPTPVPTPPPSAGSATESGSADGSGSAAPIEPQPDDKSAATATSEDPQKDAPPPATTKPNATTKTTPATKPAATSKSTTTKPKTGGAKAKQADCQPAGQYNGFDPRPVCK